MTSPTFYRWTPALQTQITSSSTSRLIPAAYLLTTSHPHTFIDPHHHSTTCSTSTHSLITFANQLPLIFSGLICTVRRRTRVNAHTHSFRTGIFICLYSELFAWTNFCTIPTRLDSTSQCFFLFSPLTVYFPFPCPISVSPVYFLCLPCFGFVPIVRPVVFFVIFCFLAYTQ